MSQSAYITISLISDLTWPKFESCLGVDKNEYGSHIKSGLAPVLGLNHYPHVLMRTGEG